MATRSTITISEFCNITALEFNRSVNLYRHWDGYPECTGLHLAHAARGATSIEEIVAKLLTEGEGSPHGGGRYEFTGAPEMHADREWHYEITTRYGKQPLIRVEEHPIGEDMLVVFNGDISEYRKWIKDRLVAMIQYCKAA